MFTKPQSQTPQTVAPFEITAIDGDYAKLDLINKPVPLAELCVAT